MVFDLGRELGIPVIEEDLQPYDLYTADEAFFTSTSPCVLPVTRVDRRPIGAGSAGSGRTAAPRGVERDGGRGHRGGGEGIRVAGTARVPARLLRLPGPDQAARRAPDPGRAASMSPAGVRGKSSAKKLRQKLPAVR